MQNSENIANTTQHPYPEATHLLAASLATPHVAAQDVRQRRVRVALRRSLALHDVLDCEASARSALETHAHYQV